MMRGVQRTVAVFDCFTPQRPSLTLQEISGRIRLPKSTTFRIVQSLEQVGYLIRLEDQKYCLSFRFTRLAGHLLHLEAAPGQRLGRLRLLVGGPGDALALVA